MTRKKMKMKASKSKSVDWKVIAQILGILIRLLLKAIKMFKKQSQTAQDSKE